MAEHLGNKMGDDIEQGTNQVADGARQVGNAGKKAADGAKGAFPSQRPSKGGGDNPAQRAPGNQNTGNNQSPNSRQNASGNNQNPSSNQKPSGNTGSPSSGTRGPQAALPPKSTDGGTPRNASGAAESPQNANLNANRGSDAPGGTRGSQGSPGGSGAGSRAPQGNRHSQRGNQPAGRQPGGGGSSSSGPGGNNTGVNRPPGTAGKSGGRMGEGPSTASAGRVGRTGAGPAGKAPLPGMKNPERTAGKLAGKIIGKKAGMGLTKRLMVKGARIGAKKGARLGYKAGKFAGQKIGSAIGSSLGKGAMKGAAIGAKKAGAGVKAGAAAAKAGAGAAGSKKAAMATVANVVGKKGAIAGTAAATGGSFAKKGAAAGAFLGPKGAAVGGIAGGIIGVGVGIAGGAAAGAAAGGAVGAVLSIPMKVAGMVAASVFVEIIKWFFRLAIAFALFLAVFAQVPGFLFHNPRNVADRALFDEVYVHFFEAVENEYRKDFIRERAAAIAGSDGHVDTLRGNLYALLDNMTGLTDAQIEVILDALEEAHVPPSVTEGAVGDSDYVHWFSEGCDTLFTIEEYVEAISGNINLILAILDLGSPHWYAESVFTFLNEITGGWFLNFSHSFSMWWTGLFVDFVSSHVHAIDFVIEIIEECHGYYDDEGEWQEDYRDHVYITFTFTYDMQDRGFSYYVNTKLADENGIVDEVRLNRAFDIAHHLGELFGNNNLGGGMFIPPHNRPGGWRDPVSSGTLADDIRRALALFENEIAGMIYDPSAPQVFPLPGRETARPSSFFGHREFMMNGRLRRDFHTGLDWGLAGQYGRPVVSVADGIVIITRYSRGWGNQVVVYHGRHIDTNMPILTQYAHFRARNPFNVRPGDFVSAGDVIGFGGNTGWSTDPHLHFQVHVTESFSNRCPIGFFGFLSHLLPCGNCGR